MAREREMVCLAVLSIAGAAGGISLLLTQGGPAWLRLMAATLVTFVWPGWALISLVRPRATLPPVERLAVATAASAAPLALEALAAYSLGLTMRQLQVAHVLAIGLLSIGAIVRTARCRVDPDGARGDRSDYVILAAAVVFAVALWFAAPSYGPDLHERSDGWYHLGYMSFLSSAERITPNCAFYQEAPPDPRYPYSASHLSMASVVALSALPVLEVWAFFAWAFCVAMVSAVYFFVRTVFNHRVLALAATTALIAGMLMPDMEPIRSLSFRLSASPAVVLFYPYPYSLATRVLAPVLLGVVALYLKCRRRWMLVLIGAIAFGAPAFHVSQALYVPLFFISLVVVCLVARSSVSREAGKAAVVALSALLPFAAIIAVAARPAAAGVAEASAAVGHPILGQGMRLVEPQSMLFPWVLGAIAAAYIAALARRARPSGMVMVAAVVLLPLLPMNPVLAPIVARYATYTLLTRLYYPVPSTLYFAAFFIGAGLIACWIYGWLGLAAKRRNRLGPIIGSPVGASSVALLFLLVAWRGMRALPALLKHLRAVGEESLALPLAVGLVALAIPLIARLAARSLPRLLPESPRQNGLMVVVVVGLFAVLGVQLCRGDTALRRRTGNDLTCWQLDPQTGTPTFLQAIADDAPPYTAVVYATDPFAAEITPAFARQHILFYDMNSNPAADREERRREWEMLGNPQTPLAARRRLLAERNMKYVVLSNADEATTAAVCELAESGVIVYQDTTATVWRVGPEVDR